MPYRRRNIDQTYRFGSVADIKNRRDTYHHQASPVPDRPSRLSQVQPSMLPGEKEQPKVSLQDYLDHPRSTSETTRSGIH